MCQAVEFPATGEYVTSIGDLRTIWPKLVPRDPNGTELVDDCCLCPVDLEATAEANGAKVKWDRDGEYYIPGDYIVLPQEAKPA